MMNSQHGQTRFSHSLRDNPAQEHFFFNLRRIEQGYDMIKTWIECNESKNKTPSAVKDVT